MNGISEPGPVIGASRYSHLVSTAPCTSVSRSKFADVPLVATPTVVRLPGWLDALKLPAPLVKSSSTAHTPFTLPTSPVIVNTPRSRENHVRSLLPRVLSGRFGDCPAWLLVNDRFMPAVVTKSTSPLIVTFGAGPCAKLDGARTPMATRTARTMTPALFIASPHVWCGCK